MEGIYLNVIKAVFDKSTHSQNYNGGKLGTFLLRYGTRQGYPLLPLVFNIVLEILARAISQEK